MAYLSRWLKRGSPSKIDSQGADSQLSTLNEDFFMFDSQIEEEANNDDSAMIGLRRFYISHLGGGPSILDGWHATRGNFGRSRGSRGLTYISPDGRIFKNKAAVASVLKLGAFSQPAVKPVKTTIEHNVPTAKKTEANEKITADATSSLDDPLGTPTNTGNLDYSKTESVCFAEKVRNNVAEDSDSDELIEGIACSSPNCYEEGSNNFLLSQSSAPHSEQELDSCEVHRALMSVGSDDEMDDDDDICFAQCVSPSRDASMNQASSSEILLSSPCQSFQDGLASNLTPVTPSKVKHKNCEGNYDIFRNRRKSCDRKEPKNDEADLVMASSVSYYCSNSIDQGLSYDSRGQDDDANDDDDDDGAFETCSSPSALAPTASLPDESSMRTSKSKSLDNNSSICDLSYNTNTKVKTKSGVHCSQLSQTGKKSHARKRRGYENDSTGGFRSTRARRTIKTESTRVSEKGTSMTVTIETARWLQDKVLPAIASVISMESEFEAILDAQPEIHARPKGRAPAEKVWEASLGTWVDVRWAYWHESVYKNTAHHNNDCESATEEEKSKLQKAQERWTAKQNLEARLHAEIRALHKKLIDPPMGKQPTQVTSMLQNVRSASLKQNLASLQEAASAVSDYCLAATIEFELEL